MNSQPDSQAAAVSFGSTIDDERERDSPVTMAGQHHGYDDKANGASSSSDSEDSTAPHHRISTPAAQAQTPVPSLKKPGKPGKRYAH